MAERQCCIEGCHSSSCRPEDVGVSYHKFPLNANVCNLWFTSTKTKDLPRCDTTCYVCSRHFRLVDFESIGPSKYKLKSDAVPTIFPWGKFTVNMENDNTSNSDAEYAHLNEINESFRMNNITKAMDSDEIFDISNVSKNIKPNTICGTEKNNLNEDNKLPDNTENFNNQDSSDMKLLHTLETTIAEVGGISLGKTDPDEIMEQQNNSVICDYVNTSHTSDSMSDRTLDPFDRSFHGIMNSDGNILDQMIAQKNAHYKKGYKKKTYKNGLISDVEAELSVGTRVQVKDYNDCWHSAEIIEHDQEEMEVLIHYDEHVQKQDEWIKINSARLKVFVPSSNSGKLKTLSFTKKQPLVYKVGEKCLATWSDSRKFQATVTKVLNDDKYEVQFYDGFIRVCKWNKLTKIKQTGDGETSINTPLSISIDSTSQSSNASSLPTPPLQSTSVVQPFYHKHLFDPAIDYLGSKKERREMKRKLNVKEIFNIGQSRRKSNENTFKVKVTRPLKKKNREKRKSNTSSGKAFIKLTGTENNNKDNLIVAASKLDEYNDDIKLSELLKENKHNEQNNKHGKVPCEDTNINLNLDLPLDIDDTIFGERVTSPSELLLIEKKVEEMNESIETKNQVQTQGKQAENEKLGEIQPELKKEEAEFLKNIASREGVELMENGLRKGEWCCHWFNGQPLGIVTELPQLDGETPILSRKSVQVEDYRLPPGWSKHMVRRSHGTSAGKWDVVMVCPEGKKYRTKSEMLVFLSTYSNDDLKEYEAALLDFGVHRKLSKQLGWDVVDVSATLPRVTINPLSPLTYRNNGKQKKTSSDTSDSQSIKRCLIDATSDDSNTSGAPKKRRISDRQENVSTQTELQTSVVSVAGDTTQPIVYVPLSVPLCPADGYPFLQKIDDNHVYVGSLVVQILENLLRCPAEGCFKNFRKENLLRMHIKHYHKELKRKMGSTPKVSELASARTQLAEVTDDTPKRTRKPKAKVRTSESDVNTSAEKSISDGQPVQLNDETLPQLKADDVQLDDVSTKPIETKEKISQPINKKYTDSKHSSNKKRHRMKIVMKKKIMNTSKVLKKNKPSQPHKSGTFMEQFLKTHKLNSDSSPIREKSKFEMATTVNKHTTDFEDAIQAHTVEKQELLQKRPVAQFSESEDTDSETRSGFGSIDARLEAKGPETPSSQQSDYLGAYDSTNNTYITETGERIKIVSMKREEIINCHCGFREEDGLMVQCELCLCWQHGICHNIELESQVPDKYVCSICLNPKRGRRSQRWLNDQSALYEGVLPSSCQPPPPPSESLRRLYELSGNLIRVSAALHALKCKLHVANKKDHPKLYLWAKDWDQTQSQGQDKDYTNDILNEQIPMQNFDLNSIMDIDKENLPLKSELSDTKDFTSLLPSSEDSEEQRSNDIGNDGQALLSNLLGSPGSNLDLPISTSELERLAKSVQEAELMSPNGPVPEAAIEPAACRAKLLNHVQRAITSIDGRLDYIEAQIAELESQDPSFEDDETAEYYPRTKQTIQMLLRDLTTLEELSQINN